MSKMSFNKNITPIDIQFTPEQLKKLTEYTPRPQFDFEIPNYPIKNPNEKVEGFLKEANEKLESQTKELKSIRYENMKLNAQIDILNKTIDTQNNKLSELQIVNANLKQANKTLIENNKNYWRNTILAGLLVSGIFFCFGIHFPTIKSQDI